MFVDGLLTFPGGAVMNDLDILRQAQLLLGQYGFVEEQDTVAKAIRIIAATTRRLAMASETKPVASHESLGERLKRMRERAGLSRAQLADLCGVVTATVRAHENSLGAITPEAAQAYAQALGSTSSMILRGRE